MDDRSIEARIAQIKALTDEKAGSMEFFEGANVAQSVLFDTVGMGHPIAVSIANALQKSEFRTAVAGARSVVKLYEQGALTSPRLRIAHEIEGDLLDIAQAQASAAEKNRDEGQKHTQLAIAAFLAGAALEDGLRRLADAAGLAYDRQRTTLSKLQAVLYQPAKGIEIISNTENKQITAWGDTRNNADHGRFTEITHTDVLTMIMGVRSFLDKHLP